MRFHGLALGLRGWGAGADADVGGIAAGMVALLAVQAAREQQSYRLGLVAGRGQVPQVLSEKSDANCRRW